MEKRVLGKTGMEVTILGYGSSEIATSKDAQESITKMLNTALDAGLNIIDTGECYGDSEELIGSAVSHRRNDYFLFTKVGHAQSWGSVYNLEGEDWQPSMMQKSIDRSLSRLKTDRLDLIQLHSCSEELLRAGDVIEVLRQAQQAGKSRFIGYSGDGLAAKYAVECGAFDTLQTSINIADQQSIDFVMPLAVEKNMGVIAKRPIANTAWKTGDTPNEGYAKPYWERLQKLQYDFLNGDMSTAVQKALQFTLSVPGVHTAIVGTSNPERWKSNAALIENSLLEHHEFEAIRETWKNISSPDWVGQT